MSGVKTHNYAAKIMSKLPYSAASWRAWAAPSDLGASGSCAGQSVRGVLRSASRCSNVAAQASRCETETSSGCGGGGGRTGQNGVGGHDVGSSGCIATGKLWQAAGIECRKFACFHTQRDGRGGGRGSDRAAVAGGEGDLCKVPRGKRRRVGVCVGVGVPAEEFPDGRDDRSEIKLRTRVRPFRRPRRRDDLETEPN